MTTTSSFVSTIPALAIWVVCSLLNCVLLIVTSDRGEDVEPLFHQFCDDRPLAVSGRWNTVGDRAKIGQERPLTVTRQFACKQPYGRPFRANSRRTQYLLT